MLVTLIMVVSSKISFGASSSNLCNGTLVTYTVQELVFQRTLYLHKSACLYGTHYTVNFFSNPVKLNSRY